MCSMKSVYVDEKIMQMMVTFSLQYIYDTISQNCCFTKTLQICNRNT